MGFEFFCVFASTLRTLRLRTFGQRAFNRKVRKGNQKPVKSPFRSSELISVDSAQNAIYSQRARDRAATSPVLFVCDPGGARASTAVHFSFSGHHHGLLYLWGYRQELAAIWHLRTEWRRDFSDLYPAAGISRVSRRDIYDLRH